MIICDFSSHIVDNMDENDKAAVIDFDSYAKVNCELTSDKNVIKSAIDRIYYYVDRWGRFI